MKPSNWATALLPVLSLSAGQVGAADAVAADVPQAIEVTKSEGPPIPEAKPGFFGKVDVAPYPNPRLVSKHPVLIRPLSAEDASTPLYMHVPPAHRKGWAKHCRDYNACGRPVYFVTEEWFNGVYVPDYNEEVRRRTISREKNSGSRQGVEF